MHSAAFLKDLLQLSINTPTMSRESGASAAITAILSSLFTTRSLSFGRSALVWNYDYDGGRFAKQQKRKEKDGLPNLACHLQLQNGKRFA